MTRSSPRRSGIPGSGGAFTLLELVVVIAILGILGTLVVVKVAPALIICKATKVDSDLKTIVKIAEIVYTMRGTYPESLEELANPQNEDGTPLPGLGELFPDPWGHDYVYELRDNRPVAICLGKDGREGGTGEDADVGWPRPKSQ